MYHFTIRLKNRLLADSVVGPLRLKLDLGANITGMAVLPEGDKSEAIFLEEIHHGTGIKKSLNRKRPAFIEIINEKGL